MTHPKTDPVEVAQASQRHRMARDILAQRADLSADQWLILSGCRESVWVDWYKALMAVEDAIATTAALRADNERLRRALTIIESWNGFPETGRTWFDGSPMSYAACFGSNGERDFMRDIARAALTTQPGEHKEESDDR